MKNKRGVLLMGCVMACLLVSAKPYTVVIDAGHGGQDAGAVGRTGLMEKDLNLDVSLRLASRIRTQYPEVNVVLTRKDDRFIPLQGRANIVNKNDADLFICVHTNAADNRNAHGAEVYILGTDRMEDNLDVAMRENAVMKLEADYKTQYQGFDPNSVDSYIMFELMQNQYMDQSLQFASLVQTEFTTTLKREDRGVRQAAFWVLLKSACPSVLVEMGFISNKDEEAYLMSGQGKREMTDALFAAFCRYYKGDAPMRLKDETVTDTIVDKTADNKVDNKVDTVAAVVRDSVPVSVSVPVPVAVNESSWRVQIFVSKTILPERDHNFRGLKGCTYVYKNGIYKYMYGNCKTREEALQLQKELKSKFADCFIVKVD